MSDNYLVFRAEDVRWRGNGDASFSRPLTPAQALDDVVVLELRHLTDTEAAWYAAGKLHARAIAATVPEDAAALRDLSEHLATVASRLERS